MKKVFSVIVLLLSVSLMACKNSNDMSDTKKTTEEYVTPDEQADVLCTEVFNCFLEKDTERLKKLFSINVQNTCELDLEIQEAFDFIEGAIISYEEPDGSIQGKRIDESEGVVLLNLGGVIRNIETDIGKRYRISFTSYAIDKKDEDNVGIISIGVIDEELEEQSNYDGEEFRCGIGKDER